MAIEYKEYNSPYETVKKPVNNEPEPEPVNNITDSDIISDALKIMQHAQLNNNEPEPEPNNNNNNTNNNNNDIVIDPNILTEIDQEDILNEIPDNNIEKNEDILSEDTVKEIIENNKPEPEPVKEPVNEPEPEPEPDYLNFKHSSTFFKRLFDLIGVINNETRINFTKDNINLRLVDPANVEMINLEIPINAISEYRLNNDLTLGLDIDKIKHILKSNKNNDYFDFIYNSDKNTNKAYIKNGIFSHEICLIDISGLPEPSKLPVLNLPARVVIDTKIFYDFLVQADKISDHIIINISSEYLQLSAIGDSDNLNVTIDKNNFYELYCNRLNSYRSLFSIDYLLATVKQLKPIFDKLELNLGSDNPLKIIGNNGYKAEILLAPRIESE